MIAVNACTNAAFRRASCQRREENSGNADITSQDRPDTAFAYVGKRKKEKGKRNSWQDELRERIWVSDECARAWKG